MTEKKQFELLERDMEGDKNSNIFFERVFCVTLNPFHGAGNVVHKATGT
jgi:hypothetical protein